MIYHTALRGGDENVELHSFVSSEFGLLNLL